MDANHGAVLMAASTSLTAIQLVGANPDGEALAAFNVGYVGVRAPSFGASTTITRSDLLWQAAWEANAIQHEYFRERLPAFALHYFSALEAFETDAPNAYFYDTLQDIAGWAIDRENCLSLMRTMRDGIDESLADKSRDWR